MLPSSPSELNSISNQDIIIAVMGATGVGKSSFINLAIEGDRASVGHGLRSYTQGVQAVRCRHPHNPNQQIVFLDTPGFDDTSKSDVEVIMDITEWLNATYKRGILLAGILFLHRISDNRVAGTAMRNKGMFEKLCGLNALHNVILVTTMWDKVYDLPAAEAREKDLSTNYWKSMIASGAQMKRHQNSYQSAWNILDQLTGPRQPLQIQREMVDEGKSLPQTAAGSALFEWLDKFIAQLKALIEAFKVRLRAVPKDSGSAKQLLGEISANEKDLHSINAQKALLASQSKHSPRRPPEKSPAKQGSPSSARTKVPQSKPAPKIALESKMPLDTERLRTSSSATTISTSSFQVHQRPDEHRPLPGPPYQNRRAKMATNTKDVPDMTPLPFIKDALYLISKIIDSIEATKRQDSSLINLLKNAHRLRGAIGEPTIVNVSEDMRAAVLGFSKELENVQIVLKRISSLGRAHPYVLQDADKKVFLACNESIRAAADLFLMKTALRTKPAVKPTGKGRKAPSSAAHFAPHGQRAMQWPSKE